MSESGFAGLGDLHDGEGCMMGSDVGLVDLLDFLFILLIL